MIGEESRNQYVRDLEKERDQLRAELEKVNGFRDQTRTKLRIKSDCYNEAIAQLEILRAHNALLLAVANAAKVFEINKNAPYADSEAQYDLRKTLKAAKEGGALVQP